MNEQERYDMFEKFIFMHQGMNIPHAGTRVEERAHELARPILLDMVREYADKEIAGIRYVCGHNEQEKREEWPTQHQAAKDLQDQEALATWEKAFGAYEEACAQRSQQDSQFLKHVHAIKCALFIDIRDKLVNVIRENVGYTVDDSKGYRNLRSMTPDMGFTQLLCDGANIAIELGADDDYSTVLTMVEAALNSTFEEVHDV